jgi:hypothetical protein
MNLGGSRANAKPVSHFFAAAAARHETQHFALAFG